MISDWRMAIAKMYLAKQKLWAADPKGLYKRALPRVAASENEISAAEIACGRVLDPAYCEFLRSANGWPSFWYDTDLFGTKELISNPLQDQIAMIVDLLEQNGILSEGGVERRSLMCVAAAVNWPDHFFLVTEGTLKGHVIWYAGYEIDRFSTFDEYFLSMVAYIERRAQLLAEGRRGVQ
jgi:hypothetical protein